MPKYGFQAKFHNQPILCCWWRGKINNFHFQCIIILGFTKHYKNLIGKQ